jgi:hypothetical protein
MTYQQIDERKEYVKQARASFEDAPEWTSPAPASNEPALGGTMLFRLLLGLLLFLLFVLADVTEYTLFGYGTKDVEQAITAKEDYTNLEKYVMMLFDKSESL